MTAAGSRVGDSGHRNPDDRALSRWSDQLKSLAPRELWVGTLDLSHLDAGVRVSRLRPLDPFHRHLLAAAVTMPVATPAALDAFLGVGPTLSRWLGEIVSWILPLIFIVALWTFFFRRMGGAEGGVM